MYLAFHINIISGLEKSSKNSRKNHQVSLSQLLPLLTFDHICVLSITLSESKFQV